MKCYNFSLAVVSPQLCHRDWKGMFRDLSNIRNDLLTSSIFYSLNWCIIYSEFKRRALESCYQKGNLFFFFKGISRNDTEMIKSCSDACQGKLLVWESKKKSSWYRWMHQKRALVFGAKIHLCIPLHMVCIYGCFRKHLDYYRRFRWHFSKVF